MSSRHAPLKGGISARSRCRGDSSDDISPKVEQSYRLVRARTSRAALSSRGGATRYVVNRLSTIGPWGRLDQRKIVPDSPTRACARWRRAAWRLVTYEKYGKIHAIYSNSYLKTVGFGSGLRRGWRPERRTKVEMSRKAPAKSKSSALPCVLKHMTMRPACCFDSPLR